MNFERKTRDALEKAIISVFLAEADAGKGPTEDEQFEEVLKSLPEDQREAARAAYKKQKEEQAAVPDQFSTGTEELAAMKKSNAEKKAEKEYEERAGAARGVSPLEQAEGQVLYAKQQVDKYGTGNDKLANALRTLAFVEKESGQKSQVWGTLSQAYFDQMGAAAQDLIIAAAASAGAPKASVPSPGLPRSETGKLPATGPSSPQSRPRPTQPQARTPVQTPGLKVSEPTKRETYKIEIQSTQPAPAAPTPSPFPTTIGTPKPEKVPTVVGTSRGGQTTAPPSSSVPFPTKPEMPNIPAKPYTAPATSVQLPTSQNQVMVAPDLSPVVPPARGTVSTVQPTKSPGLFKKAVQTVTAGVIATNATAAAGKAPSVDRTPTAVVTSAPKATTTTTITPVVTTTPGKVNIPGRTPVAAPTQSARSTAAPSQAASARIFNFGAYLTQKDQQAQQAVQAQQSKKAQEDQQAQQTQQAQKVGETAPLKSQGKEEVAQAQKQTQASKAEQTTKQTTSTASSLTQIAQNAITGVVSSIANQIINTPGKVGVGTPPVAPVPPIVPGGGEREKSPKQRSRPSFDFKATGIDPVYIGIRSNLLKLQQRGGGSGDLNIERPDLAGYNREAWFGRQQRIGAE